MRTHQHEFSVQVMGRAFGVSRSGYYAWRAQDGLSQLVQKDVVLTELIRGIFEQRGQTYGSPRVYAELSHGDACGKSPGGGLQSSPGRATDAPGGAQR
jgi:putative transposase